MSLPPRPVLSSPDYYTAIGTAVGCWDTTPLPHAPGTLDQSALERSIATGLSHLFRLVSAPPSPMATAAATPPLLPLPAITAAMAHDASLPEATTAALLARLYVDVQAVPTVQAAFASLPLPVLRVWAADWADLAHAAWAAGWYPELIGRPTYAAGALSGGWPVLFEAAARAFDDIDATAPGAPAEARRPTLAAPTATLPLPRRVGPAKAPLKLLISHPASYLDGLRALNSATPSLPPDAAKVIEEFGTTVVYHALTTGNVPVAAWVSMPTVEPNHAITVYDARHQPPLPVQPPTHAPPHPLAAPPAGASPPLQPSAPVTATAPTAPAQQAVPCRPAALHRPPVAPPLQPRPTGAPPGAQVPARPRPPAARPPQSATARPIAGSAATPAGPRNAPPPLVPAR
ncbi:hypothetical protein [Azospirillum canadense]|uniref:hypothetical protein n=1 Tax=Azospirillum canadense TaxID=403962 RepID=UPI002227190E|nr:hypothetical protein [Azospirillum canadense]MCW2240770.1 hypothetical protein [Azospirillum canadense]